MKSQKKPIPEEKPLFPMRINKYLAWKGYSTRKGGDEMVEKGLVFINDRRAVLGDKVVVGDTVDVTRDGKAKKYVYFAYNKPKGILTHSPQKGQSDIKQSVKYNVALKDVFPVGRLDRSSHGLMILTNDGRITDKLLNPDYSHEKQYVVHVGQKLRPSFKENMEKGVKIEGYITKPCKVNIVNDNTFKITLTEGKKHQIRRMVSAMHNEVNDLERIKIMNISLGTIPEGSYRTIEGTELDIFMSSLGF